MTATINIAEHLTWMAQTQPHQLAVVFPEGTDRRGRSSYTHYTYEQLDKVSDTVARGLMTYGITKGMRTVLMVPPSLDFFALTFALFKLGALPVFIDPGMGLANLKRSLKEARPSAFIGSLKAHLARHLFGWERGKILKSVVVDGMGLAARRLEDIYALGEKSKDLRLPSTFDEDVAAILFTSGSTGAAKGVVYHHRHFDAQVESFKTLYAIQPGEIDLCTFPLFALFAPALGMTAVIPKMDFTRPAKVDPKCLFTAITDFGVTNMFGSPALVKRVAEEGSALKIKLPTLKRIISAGAPVSAQVIAELQPMLSPQAQILTPYGATEALPVTSIGSREILSETRELTDQGRGVCVGRVVPGINLMIIQITDSPIAIWSDSLLVADGTIGEIVVSGRQVTERYYNNPTADALGKIQDIPRGVTCHRMGDLGYRDDCGRIWFCGRKNHRVALRNKTLYTIPVEAIFNTHPEVARSALVGVEQDGHLIPVLCIEPRARLKKDCGERLKRELITRAYLSEGTKEIKTVLFCNEFPVDIRHNAKIFREKLGVWAAKELGCGH